MVNQQGVSHALGPANSPVALIYRDGQYMMKLAATAQSTERLPCKNQGQFCIAVFCDCGYPMLAVVLHVAEG